MENQNKVGYYNKIVIFIFLLYFNGTGLEC